MFISKVRSTDSGSTTILPSLRWLLYRNRLYEWFLGSDLTKIQGVLPNLLLYHL